MRGGWGWGFITLDRENNNLKHFHKQVQYVFPLVSKHPFFSPMKSPTLNSPTSGPASREDSYVKQSYITVYPIAAFFNGMFLKDDTKLETFHSSLPVSVFRGPVFSQGSCSVSSKSRSKTYRSKIKVDHWLIQRGRSRLKGRQTLGLLISQKNDLHSVACVRVIGRALLKDSKRLPCQHNNIMSITELLEGYPHVTKPDKQPNGLWVTSFYWKASILALA